MVNLICGDLTAFAYPSLSNPDNSQTSVNLSWALMCACVFFVKCMDHLNYIFPSLKPGKIIYNEDKNASHEKYWNRTSWKKNELIFIQMQRDNDTC